MQTKERGGISEVDRQDIKSWLGDLYEANEHIVTLASENRFKDLDDARRLAGIKTAAYAIFNYLERVESIIDNA